MSAHGFIYIKLLLDRMGETSCTSQQEGSLQHDSERLLKLFWTLSTRFYDNENEMPDFVILVDSLHRTKDTAGCTYITFFYVKHVGFLKCKILSGSDDQLP